MTTELRDYQCSMLQDLYKAWKRTQSVMVQMPTGTGKTHLMATVIRCLTPAPSPIGEGSRYPGGKALIVAHRRELIAQISQMLDGFGVEHGLIVSGQEVDFSQKVQVASIQTLARRIDAIQGPLPKKRGRKSAADIEAEKTVLDFSLIIIDEAHHALADTYRMLWDKWPGARFLGLTATPCRLNNAPFTDLFQKLLQSWTIQEFIDKGWLSDFEYVSASPDSAAMRKVRLLKKRGTDGDYQTREMATVLDVPESIEHLFSSYNTYARGKKGIVYAFDRQHAQHISEYYSTQGVKCCWIEAKTPTWERQQLVEDYRTGKVDVIVNVDIFSEGFDCPEVEFIQLARPTLSLSKYLQQVGRGMRVSVGKGHVLILDQVGLYQTFGLPTVDRDWQQLFLGHESGKGQEDISRCVVVNDKADKGLVNPDMVRIKRAGQKGAGLEVFLQNGRYGIMNRGKIACPAKFKRVERLQTGCGFFALAIYMMPNKYNFGHLMEVTTVIDRAGQDLHVQLYGTVRWVNGLLCGVWEGIHSNLTSYWDPVGNTYYEVYPNFTTIAGVEVGFAYEHHSRFHQCLKLRVSTGKVSPRFNEWDMFYNRDIIVARDYLIVKRDHNHSYRICGYQNDSVLVESEEQYGYQQIMLNGKKGLHFKTLPQEATRVFNYQELGLQRVRLQDNGNGN